ncbi:MAG TPA: phage tail protein I [Xanthobacteraceae bacterium]|nr:phage tail protein I [Xanthobacteraceae bacterium]
MTTAANLLPRNLAPFEIALGEAMTDELPVPIRVIVDPAETPEEFLPFLAAHESVDLWFDDWSTDRKREMVGEAPVLATLKGTRDGSTRFLSYVDGTLLDVIAHPTRFVMGRAILGRTPIGHPAFVARYLVHIETFAPKRSFVMGRGVIGRARLKTPSREKFQRVLISLRVAKAPETEIRVDFRHKRMLTLTDAPPLDAGFYLGQYLDRSKL